MLLTIEAAASALRAGRLVAFGTETVYGLGADATNALAVAAIFEAKGRPRFNPLICHLPDAEAAFRHGIAGPMALRLAEAFWPGPLTMVLVRRGESGIADLVCAGGATVGLRVPALAAARTMLAAVGRPVAAPSANRSGRISPTTADAALAELGGSIEGVLDTGPCVVGLESTVIDLTGSRPRLLRPGGVEAAAIEAVIGHLDEGGGTDPVLRSPGLLLTHYAPVLPLRLDAVSVAADEALLAFNGLLPGARLVAQLSETGDLREAAARLFASLRLLDESGRARGLRGIAAMPVPAVGLGVAIRDRLARAAGQ